MDDSDFEEPPAKKTMPCLASPVSPSKMDTICRGYIPPNTKKVTSWAECAFEQWWDQQNEKSKFAARYDLLSFSISHILENICIAQDILENMNTTQDALSGTGYNVYSFALMFRPPRLQTLLYHSVYIIMYITLQNVRTHASSSTPAAVFGEVCCWESWNCSENISFPAWLTWALFSLGIPSQKMAIAATERIIRAALIVLHLQVSCFKT